MSSQVNRETHSRRCGRRAGRWPSGSTPSGRAGSQPAAWQSCAGCVGSPAVVQERRLAVVGLKLDEHLLALAKAQLAQLDVDVVPVGREDGVRRAGHFANPEPVPVDDLHAQFHIRYANGHHATYAAHEKVAQIIPDLDERVCAVVCFDMSHTDRNQRSE